MLLTIVLPMVGNPFCLMVVTLCLLMNVTLDFLLMVTLVFLLMVTLVFLWMVTLVFLTPAGRLAKTYPDKYGQP